jgi:hypothetical protein
MAPVNHAICFQEKLRGRERNWFIEKVIRNSVLKSWQ